VELEGHGLLTAVVEVDGVEARLTLFFNSMDVDFRMVAVVVFLFFFFMFRGPVRNPLWEYLSLRGGRLDRLVQRIRFFQDYGVFCGCSEFFYDVRITAEYLEGQRVWFLRRDRDAAGLNLRSDLTRLTLAFYYKRNSFFMSPAILSSARRMGGLRSLEIQSVKCSSLDFDRSKAEVVERFYFWKL
jgi:hypothetical protein